MNWRKIDIKSPPIGTVIATDFEDCPVVGVIKIKNGRAYCELPYMNLDDGSYYSEQVTHFIAMHQFEHEVGEQED
jgi:hypothetical protein